MAGSAEPTADGDAVRLARLIYWLTAGCVVLAVCACLLFTLVGGYVLWQDYRDGLAPTDLSTVTPTTTPSPAATITTPAAASATPSRPPTWTTTPTPSPSPSANLAPRLQPPAAVLQDPTTPAMVEALARLWEMDTPPRDYLATTQRLSGRVIPPITPPATLPNLGDTHLFRLDGRTLSATLMAVTPHLYFWVEEGLGWDSAETQTIADQVENDLLPQLLSLFQADWPIGLDKDPHVSVLHLDSADPDDELGFFDRLNQYPRALEPDSNEQEMIFMNMRALRLGERLYLATLLHELEHVIQWSLDANEALWLDEGLAQLTELYSGFNTAASADYLREPATPLNQWAYDDEAVYAHYAAGYLFAVYLWEQLGDAAIGYLMQQSADGLAAVQATLGHFRPETSLEEFLVDWATANLLNDPQLDRRYGYRRLRLGTPRPIDRMRGLPYERTGHLESLGVDYIALQASSPFSLTLAADTQTTRLPFPAHSGTQVWLAAPGDDSDAQLTHAFDLGDLTSATLQFWAWYDLETDYDFAYVLVSADHGSTWDVLDLQHAARGDFGPAFNGRSRDARDDVRGWVSESLSLNAYLGRPILVRFELLTDAATTGDGLALDDIAIPELRFFDDTESGPGAWRSLGFGLGGVSLPQNWGLRLVIDSDPPVVRPLTLDAYNQGEWVIDLHGQPATLIVMPLNPFTTHPATYWLRLTDQYAREIAP